MNLLLIFCLVVTIGIASGHRVPYFHQSYTGERMKTQHAIDSRQCYAICKRNPNCRYWSFFIKPEKCVLYSSFGGMKHKKGVVSGELASATNSETTTGDNRICGEDLDTLHGLLIASSNTFVAHCCNNGNTTNKITCGNGVDCSSVCDFTPTCAKVVIEPEEGEDLCSTRDSYAIGIKTPCNSQGQTNCGRDAYGETTTPPKPKFCTEDTYYVKKKDWQPGTSCCTCTTCKFCDCCPTYEEIIDMFKGITSSQSFPPTSPSQSSIVNIDWKRGMPFATICVSPGTIVSFKWDSTAKNHNVVRLPPQVLESFDVTGLDNQSMTAPHNLNHAPFIYGGANDTSFFFTSGVAGDSDAGMKAKITISNNSNCEVWKHYPGPGDPSGLVSIAAGEFGVWGLRSDDSIWRKKKASKGWTPVYGSLTDVSVGKDSVWGVILPEGNIWRWYDSTKWQYIPGTLKQVSVSGVDDAVVWGVNFDGSINRRNGSNWETVEGIMSMVSCGQTGVWALGVLNGGYGDIFYRTGTYGGVNSAGTGWEKVSGGLSWISTGSAGEVWGVGAGVGDGTLYKRQGITESKPSGDAYAWTHMVQPEGGKAMKQVAVFDGNLWGLVTGPGPDFDSFNASAFD